jgi:hypothetical protein
MKEHIGNQGPWPFAKNFEVGGYGKIIDEFIKQVIGV